MQMFAYASAKNKNSLLSLSTRRYRVGGKFYVGNCARFTSRRAKHVSWTEMRADAPNMAGNFVGRAAIDSTVDSLPKSSIRRLIPVKRMPK